MYDCTLILFLPFYFLSPSAIGIPENKEIDLVHENDW